MPHSKKWHLRRKEVEAIETLAYALTVLLIILAMVLDHWRRK